MTSVLEVIFFLNADQALVEILNSITAMIRMRSGARMILSDLLCSVKKTSTAAK